MATQMHLKLLAAGWLPVPPKDAGGGYMRAIGVGDWAVYLDNGCEDREAPDEDNGEPWSLCLASDKHQDVIFTGPPGAMQYLDTLHTPGPVAQYLDPALWASVLPRARQLAATYEQGRRSVVR